MNFKTKYPIEYIKSSLANEALAKSVLILQQMFALMWELLEHPKRQMEAVSKLKDIILDDRTSATLYAALLMDLVVGPNLAELASSWTIDS